MSDDFSDDEEFLQKVKQHELLQKLQSHPLAPLMPPLAPAVPTAAPQVPTAVQSGVPQRLPDQSRVEESIVSDTTGYQTSTNDNDLANLPPAVRNRLFQADGEIAILRNQINQAKVNNYEQTSKLRSQYSQSKDTMDEQVRMLKFTIEKLEDEKKFLDNQLRSSYTKKRKLNDNTPTTSGISSRISSNGDDARPDPKESKIIRIQNDVSLLTDYIWKLSINGSERTVMEYLSRICLNKSVTIHLYEIKGKVPLSTIILEYLILKKDLRLDIVLENFCLIIGSLIEKLVQINMIISVPFLIAIMHGILEFKPLAVTGAVIKGLTKIMVKIVNEYKYMLNNDDMELFNYNKNPQQLVLEKFILICGMDTIERLMALSNNNGNLPEELYFHYGIEKLINHLLPRYTEALIDISQMNILYNIVEIFNDFYEHNSTDTELDILDPNSPKLSPAISQALIKINLLEIPIKPDFKFYGLNRCIGNNEDFKKIDSLIPKVENELGKLIVTLPNPIPPELRDSVETYHIKYNHEFHHLQLRLTISKFIENYLINTMDIELLKDKELARWITKIINFEQCLISRSPRSSLIGLRIEIISSLVRNLNYLFSTDKSQLNQIFDTYTLNELAIGLLIMSFGTETKINQMGQEMLKHLRQQNYGKSVFNASSELMARNLSNINGNQVDATHLAEVESDYPNGLEFAYDGETVELAREILRYCISSELADDLYYIMNEHRDEFDEMDIDI